MVKLSAEQERLTSLISDTITLLCRNGLKFRSELKIQGLLGISMDDDVFLVQIEKSFQEFIGDSPASELEPEQSSGSDLESEVCKKKKKKRKQVCQQSPLNTVKVKCEPSNEADDDLVLLERDTKMEVNSKDSTRDSCNEDNCQVLDSSYLAEITGQGLSGSTSDQRTIVWEDPLTSLASTDHENNGTSNCDNVMNTNNTGSTRAVPMQTLEPPFTHQRQSADIQQAFNWKMSQKYCQLNQRNMLLGSNNRRNVTVPQAPLSYRSRRTSTSGGKQFICGYPGCNKSYFSRTNMLHHQAYKHDRQKGEPGPCIVKNVEESHEMNQTSHFTPQARNDLQLDCPTTQNTNCASDARHDNQVDSMMTQSSHYMGQNT